MDAGTSKLFDETEIKGMKLRNRFVRSATWEGMAAADGSCTPRLVDLISSLARGGVGLIISSHAYVQKNGQAGVFQLGVYSDELIGGLREMTDAVHRHGGSIALQIAHAGFFANPKLTGQEPKALSPVEGFVKSERKSMSVEEIEEIVRSFGLAAGRAREAGFDSVQIHAAHGYLLSQSLSPVFNKRDDDYGGSLEKRSTFLMNVLREVRAHVGPEYPILIKMNSQDFLEGGLSLEESLEVGRMLQENGLDCIELSGGTFVSGEFNPSRGKINSEEKEAYFRKGAKSFKEKLDVPLILVGGIRSFNVAENLVNEGYTDYISMSRPFIREPNLVARWKSGDRTKAACLSDNQCFSPAVAGKGILCVVEEKLKEREGN